MCGGRGRLWADDLSKASPELRSPILPPEDIAIVFQGEAIVSLQAMMFGAVPNYAVLD